MQLPSESNGMSIRLEHTTFPAHPREIKHGLPEKPHLVSSALLQM